ncbi:hypothetical protein BTA51_14755 [Hahella sp. CCB-MM4]|uniref:DUF3592 domain-containing protein n=1 Tax=Hahella sp. (strain CCB-MM4) TaxID=1926491 RepID=UPI000B9B596C|nr:DUF3592 domain-containing protein [Hahella sp. CCB-MM4]OZG72778.1 hypothetical protein BTA51_14755 [Hahella sp. CCB-MM4]
MLIKKMDFWIGAAMLLGGVLLCAIGAGELLKGVSSYGWQEVPGVLLSSKVNRSRADHSVNSYQYQASFFYRYHTGVRELTGDVLYPGYARQSTREAAEDWLEKLPVGEVIVYVNPDNPKESMLAPGVHPEMLFRPLAGLFIAFLSYWLFARLRQ